MHTLLGLSSVLLVVVSAYLALVLLRRLTGWSRRRDVQLVVLAAPVVSLGLGILGVHHFAGRTCFIGVPPWDYTLGIALPVAMGVVALGALAVGVVRLALLERLVRRSGMPAAPELQELAGRLAQQLGAARPRVLLCAYDGPLALTCGLKQPTVLLSTWMLAHLDQRELESVLAHELGHVARRDYHVVWLATVLRDAFFYLPTSWAAYRQLQHEKELACDELAVQATRRPIALASALGKVWQQSLGGPSLGPAQLLVGAGNAIELRIEHLLSTETSGMGSGAVTRSQRYALAVGASALLGLLMLQAANAAVVLAPMGCGPLTLLGRSL